jgi:hypothetical protein
MRRAPVLRVLLAVHATVRVVALLEVARLATEVAASSTTDAKGWGGARMRRGRWRE